MQSLKTISKCNLAFILINCLFFTIPAMAATDIDAQDGFARAIANIHRKETNHAEHQNPSDKNLEFRGIFYGFLPCNDCTGLKATLSLKQNNNYLLVTQYAKESSREFYEKGKYSWNDGNHTVVLTPKKGGASTRRYHIENEGTLIQLKDDGTRITDEADRYVLRRSDMVQNRERHIH